jgi:hypothetical protein
MFYNNESFVFGSGVTPIHRLKALSLQVKRG